MATDTHPPSPTGFLAQRRQLIRRRYRPRRRRRRRPINQFRGLPYASLSARQETGEPAGRPPALPRPSFLVPASPKPSRGLSVATTLILRLGHN